MYQMLKKTAAFALGALLVTCFGSVNADANNADKANAPRGNVVKNVQSKTFNLQGHEKRINAYHASMTKDGKANALSTEFVAVHQGMKKGTYKYDLATARKVMQEMYASRMPAAPQGLKNRIETKK